MSIIDYLKTAIRRERRSEANEWKSRRQFNMEIDPELANAVRNLAEMFKVPNYCVVEHAFQIAFFYILKAIQDEEKSRLIGKHLTDGHLLGFSMEDEESIIRIGEDNVNWLLLDQAKNIVARYKRFKHAMVVTERTRSMDYLDKCKRELDVAVLRFADRICRHRLDYSGESSGESEKEDQENGNNIQETGRI